MSASANYDESCGGCGRCSECASAQAETDSAAHISTDPRLSPSRVAELRQAIIEHIECRCVMCSEPFQNSGSEFLALLDEVEALRAVQSTAEREKWAIAPQCNGGWVICETHDCDMSGDAPEGRELARTRGSLTDALLMALATSSESNAMPNCPSEDCPMCTGESCRLCGAGGAQVGQADGTPCEHDVIDRHEPPPAENTQPHATPVQRVLGRQCASCGSPLSDHGLPHEWDMAHLPSCPPPSVTGTYRAASPLPGATTSAVTEVLECNECGMMRSVLTGFLGEIHDCPKAGAWCLVEHRHPASGATT